MYDVILPIGNNVQFKNDVFVVMEYGHTDLEKLITNHYKKGLPEELIQVYKNLYKYFIYITKIKYNI